MATYQAAGGAGAEGMAEHGLEAYFRTGTVSLNKVFAYRCPSTSSRSSMSSRRKAKEKMKVTLVWQKIFGLSDDVKVSCTSARVPALRAHSESIVIEIVKKVTLEEARRCSGRCLA